MSHDRATGPTLSLPTLYVNTCLLCFDGMIRERKVTLVGNDPVGMTEYLEGTDFFGGLDIPKGPYRT